MKSGGGATTLEMGVGRHYIRAGDHKRDHKRERDRERGGTDKGGGQIGRKADWFTQIGRQTDES